MSYDVSFESLSSFVLILRINGVIAYAILQM